MSDTIVITPAIRSEYLRHKFAAKNGFEQGIKSLEAIRDQRLYLVEYASFEDFCRKEFGHTRQHMNRLIAAMNTAEIVEPIGSIDHESWARVLNELDDPEDKRTAYHIAELHGKVTAETLKSSVKAVQDMRDTGGYVDTGNGEMTPIGAAIDIETQERLARQKQHIADNSQWERVETCELPAGKVATKLISMGVDPAEVIKITVYKRKA